MRKKPIDAEGAKKRPGWKAVRTAQAVHPVSLWKLLLLLSCFLFGLLLGCHDAHLHSLVDGSSPARISRRMEPWVGWFIARVPLSAVTALPSELAEHFAESASRAATECIDVTLHKLAARQRKNLISEIAPRFCSDHGRARRLRATITPRTCRTFSRWPASGASNISLRTLPAIPCSLPSP